MDDRIGVHFHVSLDYFTIDREIHVAFPWFLDLSRAVCEFQPRK